MCYCILGTHLTASEELRQSTLDTHFVFLMTECHKVSHEANVIIDLISVFIKVALWNTQLSARLKNCIQKEALRLMAFISQ